MARRGYTDIDAELLLRLANRTDITSTQRGFFIKDAYLNVAMMFKHKEIEKETSPNETLPIGADRFTPTTTDLWFPQMLKNATDGYVIPRESKERVERLITKPTAPPYRYYWWGGNFIFEALANTQKSIHIWYKRKPVDFSGTQNSELDELFDPLIIMEAARIGFETIRDFEEAETQKKLFIAEVERKKIPVEQEMLNDYRQGFKVRFQ